MIPRLTDPPVTYGLVVRTHVERVETGWYKLNTLDNDDDDDEDDDDDVTSGICMTYEMPLLSVCNM